ncbi:MAG: hypothetical protein IJA58_07975 [Lachnospiraceae bacterium]|nr:hypothetical protein [Lachnospiraceae bacterium]
MVISAKKECFEIIFIKGTIYEWFNEAYGGEQEIPATIIERATGCSKSRNRDSSSQG